MPVIRIVNLGDVVPQDQVKALMAFAKLVNPENPSEAVGKLKGVLLGEETIKDLAAFKLGDMSEEDFITKMISRANIATGKEFTPDEFRGAWNAMNPNFASFSDVLAQVIAENTDEQKIVFISHTNSFDMEFLRAQLDNNHVEYTLDDAGQLNSIAKVPLFTTYATKTSKADLILQIIGYTDFFKTAFFGKSAAVAASALDVKYVRGIQGLEDPVLKSLDQKNAAEVDLVVKTARVGTLLWNTKEKQPFNEVISKSETVYLPASKL